MRIIPSRRHDPETSHQGEEDVKVRAQSQKHKLLSAFAGTDFSLSDEEAAIIAELNIRSCWWKRCSELREEGLIQPTGVTKGSLGSDRMVCQITERGRAVLRSLDEVR